MRPLSFATAGVGVRAGTLGVHRFLVSTLGLFIGAELLGLGGCSSGYRSLLILARLRRIPCTPSRQSGQQHHQDDPEQRNTPSDPAFALFGGLDELFLQFTVEPRIAAQLVARLAQTATAVQQPARFAGQIPSTRRLRQWIGV